jgi:hypothetical protein
MKTTTQSIHCSVNNTTKNDNSITDCPFFDSNNTTKYSFRRVSLDQKVFTLLYQKHHKFPLHSVNRITKYSLLSVNNITRVSFCNVNNIKNYLLCSVGNIHVIESAKSENNNTKYSLQCQQHHKEFTLHANNITDCPLFDINNTTKYSFRSVHLTIVCKIRTSYILHF